MALVPRVWTLCTLLLFVETCLCENFIHENGTKTTIGCVVRKYDLSTTWQVRAGYDFINVTSCTLGENICVDHMPEQFRGEAVNSSDGFISWLIINNVRINETEFRCLSRYGISSTTLQVYARPSNPVCDPVELDYTKENLQFRCNVTKVFPSVSANFYIRGAHVSQQNILSSHCNNEESGSLNLDGYSAECVWRISPANLEPITYKYYVEMFPQLSNSNGISFAKAVTPDYTLQLSSPTAAIDFTQCPVGPGVMGGTIMNGTPASCRCVLETPGFPVGQARWYTVQGIRSLSRDDTTDGSSTLLIYPNATGQSFQCRAESSLNNTHSRGPVYTPIFTTRPSDPVCDPVELDYNKKDLLFTCRARNVYSFVKAMLYIKRVDWLQEGQVSTDCSNEKPGSLTLDGHSTECTWSVPAEKLKPIKYKYYVTMFPHLSISTGNSIPYVVSQDYTLQLSSPTAVIDYTHCPVGSGVVDGKIVNGSTATCRCVLKSPGFPPGQARWYTHNGNQSLGRDDVADGSSTLEIYSNTPGSGDGGSVVDVKENLRKPIDHLIAVHGLQQYGHSYQCRAESPLNNPQNWGPVYTPVFTTPSSGSETYSSRIEIVAGILAGSVGLTVIIAVVIWKWRSRKRQNDDRIRIIYDTAGVDAE